MRHALLVLIAFVCTTSLVQAQEETAIPNEDIMIVPALTDTDDEIVATTEMEETSKKKKKKKKKRKKNA